MNFEEKVNFYLNRNPKVKKVIKRIYQRIMYTVSPKVNCKGEIIRVSPDDPSHEYFFGYYDKSPWDATDRYMLCMRANDTWSDVSPKEKADIILIDTTLPESDEHRVRKIAETSAWNVQQSCMLQWLGPDFSSHILFNDCRNGKYVSVIEEIESGKEKVIPAPVYTVSADGKTALTLDFSRLYNLRPGYGYYNVPEQTKGQGLPDATAVWKIDLESGDITDLLSYRDFAEFLPRQEMKKENSVHKVNHLMINPSSNRFMVLYRWFVGQRKYSRLITCDINGDNMFLLSDDDKVSHCCWKDDNTILAFENKREEGLGYYLMHDQTKEYIHCWPQIGNDGHPSYSPDGSLIVTDTYPNRSRMAHIKIMNGANESYPEVRTIASVFAPFKYDNDTRCDLHPRWNHTGDKICFDSVYEGHRGLYYIEIPSEMNENKKKTNNTQTTEDALVSCVIPSYKRCDTVTRAIDSVLKQTYHNIEVCLVDDNVPGDEYSQRLQEALKKYDGDKRVRYITQEKHINGAAARNVGIKNARGEYIAFLDDDDEWLPEKIEKQINFIISHPEVGAVNVLWTLSNNGKEVRRCPPYTTDNLQFKIFSRKVAVLTSTVLIRKDIIEQFGGFDEGLIRHQDLQFLIAACEKTKFGLVPEYLVCLHGDSAINRPSIQKIEKIKQDFFNSVNEQFKKYSRKERIRIKNAHYYEVAFSALRSKKYLMSIKYILKTGLYPKSVKDLIRRYKER